MFDQITSDPNQMLVVGRLEDRAVACLQLTMIPSISLSGTKRAQIESVRVSTQPFAVKVSEPP